MPNFFLLLKKFLIFVMHLRCGTFASVDILIRHCKMQCFFICIYFKFQSKKCLIRYPKKVPTNMYFLIFFDFQSS